MFVVIWYFIYCCGVLVLDSSNKHSPGRILSDVAIAGIYSIVLIGAALIIVIIRRRHHCMKQQSNLTQQPDQQNYPPSPCLQSNTTPNCSLCRFLY